MTRTRRPARARGWAAAAWTTWTAACSAGEQPGEPGDPRVAGYSGCVSESDGACLLPAGGALSVWTADLPIAVRIDQAETPVTPTPAGGGYRFAVTPGDGRHTITVQTAATTARWTVDTWRHRPELSDAQDRFTRADCPRLEASFGAAPPGADPEADVVLSRCAIAFGSLDEAARRTRAASDALLAAGRAWDAAHATLLSMEPLLRRPGGLSEARARLDHLPAVSPADLGHARAVASARCRVEIRAARVRDAVAACTEARDLAERIGDTTRRAAADDQIAIAQQLAGAWTDAIGTLAASPPVTNPCARQRQRTNLAWAVLRAREAGVAGVDAPDPVALLTAGLADLTDACERAPARRANAHVNLALAELQRGDFAAARAHLVEAHRTVDPPSGDAGVPAQAAGAQPPPSVSHAAPALDAEGELWSAYIEARIHLAARAPTEALAAATQLGALARASMALEMEWRALHLAADAHAALGQPEAASTAWATASALVTAHANLVPLHLGRAAFLAEQERAARAWASARWQLGDAEGAVAVARQHRAALLRSESLAARVAHLSGEELTAWEDLIDHYHHLREDLGAAEDGAWRLRDEAAEAARSRRAALAAEAATLLDRGLAARRASAHPTDAGRAEGPAAGRASPDIVGRDGADGPAARRASPDTLPADGASGLDPAGALRPPRPGERLLGWFPLVEGWLAYAVDNDGTTAAAMPTPNGAAPPHVLGDALFHALPPPKSSPTQLTLLPYGPLREVDLHALPVDGAPLLTRLPVVYGLDLPAPTAAADGPAVVIADPRRDLPGARQEGEAAARALGVPAWTGDDATRAAALDRIAGARLLYFAGHARSAPDALDAALLLARSTELTVGDILVQPRPPAGVVLSGCATAATEDRPTEGLGLAQAFVVAGSTFAIATSRPIADATALRFGAALLEHGVDDPAAAWRSAALTVRAELPDADWSSFRIYTP